LNKKRDHLLLDILSKFNALKIQLFDIHQLSVITHKKVNINTKSAIKLSSIFWYIITASHHHLHTDHWTFTETKKNNIKK